MTEGALLIAVHKVSLLMPSSQLLDNILLKDIVTEQKCTCLHGRNTTKNSTKHPVQKVLLFFSFFGSDCQSDVTSMQ